MRAAKSLWSCTALLTLALTACVTKTEPVYSVPTPNRATTPGVAPALIVEQFLTAVNSKDLTTMGNLFGTRDGPIIQRDPKDKVEKQMFVLATVLKHDDYQIEGETIVPGRQHEATRFNVLMKIGERRVSVPFVMVRSKANAWMVEEIGIEKITNSR